METLQSSQQKIQLNSIQRIKNHIIKTGYFVVLSILSIYSCEQSARNTARPENKKTRVDTLKRSNAKEWIDTLYNADGKIETILRGKRDSTKHLDGRCETFYPTGVTKTVKFFYDDTAKGNLLEFYPDGKLLRFSYLIDNNHSVYSREYDTAGRLIAEKGNPFVGYDITENNTLDTAHIQIFLSDFGFTNLDLFVSPDRNKYFKMTPKNGKIEGTKIFKMWKHTKGLSHISVYMKVVGIDSFLRQHVYNDTLSFKR
jgi:hypothetical protein